MSYSHKKLALSAVTLVLAVGSSVTAFADNAAEATPTTTSVTPVVAAPTKVVFNFSQVVAPMQTREDAIANAWAKEFEALGAALSDRRTELTNAYALTNQKDVKAAVKAAHKKYHDAVKQARKESVADRKAAWNTFNKTVKAMKNPAPTTIEGLVEKLDDTK